MSVKILALVAGAFLCIPVYATDMKPGLWEVSTQTKLPGNMAMPDLSGLPPELLAKLSQHGVSLQAGSGAGQVKARVCVTAAQASMGQVPQTTDSHCSTGNSQKSGDMLSWQFSCQFGGHAVQGSGQAMLLSPESYVGSSSVSLGNTSDMRSSTDIQGRWLATACQ